MVKPLFKMTCDQCGPKVHEHEEIYLTQRCHEGAGVEAVVNKRNELTIACRVCQKPIAKMLVSRLL